MNVSDTKKEFPIFDIIVHNNDLIYLDSANSSQKPRVVIDRIYGGYKLTLCDISLSII